MEKQPLVSIGVPVFNGEKKLYEALTSLIEQNYKNLEIIISDNASTDKTFIICDEFLKKDKRIKYYRSEENLGSSWNFNHVFKLSSGKYFMWAAHDDIRHPSFVRLCVEKMEQSPKAVLCQAYTQMFIEGRQEVLCVSNLDSFDGITGSISQYRETLRHFPAVAIYGLYRSSAMQKTRMFEPVIATDLAFIQELSIYGSFVQVPEILFSYIGRKKWNTVHQDYKVFLGKNKKPWWYIPFIALFCNHWSRVTSSKVSFNIKLCLWWALIEWQLFQVAQKIIIKTCKRVCPASWKNKLANVLYTQWMRGPNLQIKCKDLFFERIIKPKMGWWS